MPDPETETAPAQEIAGKPLANPKPDASPAPVTDPDIPELQDRRRPKQ
jgi:hypothetical protein